MKPVLGAVAAAIIALSTNGAWADLTAEQMRQAMTFAAGVRALDPHTIESDSAFRELVERHVPASGPVRQFLDFMAAAGFECPWPPGAPAGTYSGRPAHICAFEPDLGRTAEPSLSSVTEVAWFSVVADYDEDGNIVTIKGRMTHGFIGP